jgi:hypothetical protein
MVLSFVEDTQYFMKVERIPDPSTSSGQETGVQAYARTPVSGLLLVIS